ncbi:MAG TPA: sporulation protein YunB [Oscillospiraceae bacterium]|nr:sporulation protein YunB [Oscillospiraceae bacterium]
MRRRHYRRRFSYHSGRKRVLVFIVLFIIAFVFVSIQLRPVITNVTQNEAKQMSVNAINSTVTEELTKSNIKYDDMVNIERDNNGKVLAITTNIVKMNELKSSILTAVQQKLSDQHNEVGIPLGTLLGSDFLHGRGPNVPLQLTLSGNVNGDFQSKFESAGINQTRHQIYLQVHMSVYSFIPGYNTTTEVTTGVAIAETIIVGEVPQTFANIGSGSAADAAAGAIAGTAKDSASSKVN